MRKPLLAAAVATTALLASAPTALAAAPGQAPAGAAFSYADGLRVCTSGDPEQGSAQFAVEGNRSDANNTPDYVLTPVLNPGGNAGATDPQHTCYDIDLAPGIYRITPGKYMSARCLKTANGAIVARPTPSNATGLEFTNSRCRAFVHHFHTKHANGSASVLEVPEVVVTVAANEVTEVDAHVVPENYPECTVSGTPATSPNRRCEATGPTG
ncbi:MAG TPA: hypothetical protein VGL04_12300 [Sporichthyaceae bacterium]|jgi:hypothetical protein